MNNISKYLLLALTLAAWIFSPAAPAAAQENYYNSGKLEADRADADTKPPVAGNEPETKRIFTVTSIQKCYARLSREDALEIQMHYIKPYQECQRRLAIKPKNEPGGKAEDPKNSQTGKPRNFYQIQTISPVPEKNGNGNKPEKPRIFEDRTVPLN